MRLECLKNSYKALKQKSGVNASMETRTNGFIWTLLTRQITKKRSNKKLKNNLIKNKIERANTELNRESDSTKPQSQTKMFSRRKKTILSYTLSLFYLFVAPVMQVLPVYAAEPAVAHTVWDFMVTQLVGANCIITDSAVLNAYGSALGSLNAATATAAEIDAAIASAAVNCGVDLAPIFANTANAAANIGLESATAATAGENLAASCAGFYAAGEGSAVIPAIAQTCVDVLGVAGIVAGIGYIAKMVGETMGDVVEFGQKVTNLSLLVNMPVGTSSLLIKKWSDGDYVKVTGSPVLIRQYSNGNADVYLANIGNSSKTFRSETKNGATSNYSVGAYGYYSYGSISPQYSGGTAITTDPRTYIENIRNGDKYTPLSFSPSLSGANGYLKWNSEGDPDAIVPNIPELAPLPDYANGYGLEPINPPSYQALVDAILQVPGNQEYREDQLQKDLDISEVTQPLISPHLVPLPEVNPNPNPDPDPQPTGAPDPEPTGSPDPQPTGSPNPNPNPNPKPDTQPFPDPETVPQPTPVVNPTPDSDVVPAPVPYPDPETPTDQDKTDTDTKITPFDLRDKFPFCIPFDILKIMKLFQGGREAPCFTWTIQLGEASGTVTVDLSPWDSIATLLRTLELILFIMLLAVGTRNLIGGSS